MFTRLNVYGGSDNDDLNHSIGHEFGSKWGDPVLSHFVFGLAMTKFTEIDIMNLEFRSNIQCMYNFLLPVYINDKRTVLSLFKYTTGRVVCDINQIVADTSQRFCMSACWPHVLITVAPPPPLFAMVPPMISIEFQCTYVHDWDTAVVVRASRTVMDCTSLRLQCQPHSRLPGSLLHCQ